MNAEEDVDTSRKTVKTFVPAYQKNEWKRHADELDMSQSEFVRTMVQAGRRDFEVEPIQSSRSGPNGAVGGGASGGSASGGGAGNDGRESGRNDGGNGSDGGRGEMEDRVLSILASSEHLSWDELVERLTNDVEDRLEETLQQLQAENRIQYSGRHDGYALLDENDGN